MKSSFLETKIWEKYVHITALLTLNPTLLSRQACQSAFISFKDTRSWGLARLSFSMNYHMDYKIEILKHIKIQVTSKKAQCITSLVPRYMVQLHPGSIQDRMNKLCLVEAEFMENKLAFYTPNIHNRFVLFKRIAYSTSITSL